MSSFLGKLRKTPEGKASAAKMPDASQFRDPDDPRLLFRISTRARRISLRVNSSEREVIVTVPGRKAVAKARQFAQKQADWINVQLETLPPAQPFAAGGKVTLLGETYTLICPALRGRPSIDHDAREVIVPAAADTFAGRTRRLLVREAREALETATHHYAGLLNREVEKVSVRDTRSRWGSCITRGGKGHISYSWRLIAAPSYVLDYVAAHECAHMIEANHSAAFWAVVDDIYPGAKRAKSWLAKNGADLHAVGADY